MSISAAFEQSLKKLDAAFPRFGLIGAISWVIAFWLGWKLLAYDFSHLKGLHVSPQVLIGRDFINVWTGGTLSRLGDTSVIYDISGYRFVLIKAMQLGGIYAYSYPPQTLLLAVPFSYFSYTTALALWTILGAGLFMHAARPYLATARLPMVVALVLPASIVNIWAGHYGFLVGALGLYGWRYLDKQPLIAGIFFGLLTIKPHLGVLIAMMLVFRREWVAIGTAIATTAALVAISSLFFGFELWPIYLFKTLFFQADLFTDITRAFHHMMPTTSAAFLILGFSEFTTKILQAISAAYAVAIVIQAWRLKVNTLDLGLIATVAVFLVVPYAFNYDLTVVSLAAIIFWARAENWVDHKARTLIRLIFAFAMLMPLTIPILGRDEIVIGPLILILMLGAALLVASQPPEGIRLTNLRKSLKWSENTLAHR